MKTKSLWHGALALCISLGLFTACNNQPKNEKPETPEAPAKMEMKAPQATANEDGFIFLQDYPTTDSRLAVTVSEDFSTANVNYNGKEIQEIVDEYGLASDEATVHFIDANFDGLTDLYFGPGASRTANTLYVWNDKEQEFVKAQNSTALQNPILDPTSKSFFDGGSNSFCELSVSRSTFDGCNMARQEDLTIITAPEEYTNNNVEHKYTLKDINEKVLCSTETVDGLPELWQKVVKAYGYDL